MTRHQLNEAKVGVTHLENKANERGEKVCSKNRVKYGKMSDL